MVGRIRLACRVVAGAVFRPCRHAPDDGCDASPCRGLPSLSERLEQFRQDLLGDSCQSAATQPTAMCRSQSQPGRSADDHKVVAHRDAAARPNRITRRRRKIAECRRRRSIRREWPRRCRVRRLGHSSTPIASPMVDRAGRAWNRNRPAGRKPGPIAETRRNQSIAGPSKSIIRSRPRRKPLMPSEPESRRERGRRRVDEPRIAKSLPTTVAAEGISRDDRRIRGTSHRARHRARGSGVLFTTQSPVFRVEATGPRKVVIGKEAAVRRQDSQRRRGGQQRGRHASTSPTTSKSSAHPGHRGTAQRRRRAIGASRWNGESIVWRRKAAETLNLKLVPRKSTPLDLAVQWTFTPEASQTLVEVQEPKLAMAISGPDEVLFGQSKIYKLTVSNPGNGDTENVMVGLLPIGRASEGGDEPSPGHLRAGESKTIDVELTARQAGVLTIKAQAFADGGLRTEAAEQVLVRTRQSARRSRGPANQICRHGRHVSRQSRQRRQCHRRKCASWPPCCRRIAKYVSSNGGGRLEAQQGKVNWMIGTLQPGGERVFELQCSLNAPGENRMQFITVADGDLSAAATSTTRVEALADLKLEVRDPQGPIAVGEDTVYEVHIRNRGTKAADRHRSGRLLFRRARGHRGRRRARTKSARARWCSNRSPRWRPAKPPCSASHAGPKRAATTSSGPKSSAVACRPSWQPKRPRTSTATTKAGPTRSAAATNEPQPVATRAEPAARAERIADRAGAGIIVHHRRLRVDANAPARVASRRSPTSRRRLSSRDFDRLGASCAKPCLTRQLKRSHDRPC